LCLVVTESDAIHRQRGKRGTAAKDLADFAGVFKVTVVSISGFDETAGFMDKTDPFVTVKLGDEEFCTDVKSNAGGEAEFNEEFCFDKKEGADNLRVTVWDDDTLSNDLLGDRNVDLDDESINKGEFEVTKDGKVTGKVVLEFDWD